MLKETNFIIWDWNGTLLNDVDVSISCMNDMLRKRNIPEMNKSRYGEIFTFPVIKYYKKLGFNFEAESFENLAIEYMSLYREKYFHSLLHNHVIKVLEKLKKKKKSQIILSAMEQSDLEIQVKNYNISHYFEEIIGLNNIHAKSKIDNARLFLNRNSVSPEQCIVIGDTFHDYEVAKELRCQCLLINKGHQDLAKFEFDDIAMVLEDITEIFDWIL